jgi:hypothetical protein
MPRLWIAALLLLTTPRLLRAPAPQAEDTVASCPVTKPDGKTLLSPECPGNYGGRGLWTTLPPDGKVVFSPGGAGFVLPDGSLSMKFGWCRKVRGKLTIHGRRLDAPGPPLRADIPGGYAETGFQASAIIFPTAGCWEVTGKAGKATVTFVTQVIKLKKRD